MRTGPGAVALVAALLFAAAAAAAPPEESTGEDERPALRTERRMSELAPDALPTPYSPYHSMHADAVVARALEFFGDAKGFALGSDWMLIEVEGGAAVRLLDHMRLTASFRLLDVDDGLQTQNTGIGLDGGTAAPFVGLTLDF
jgi:hypothetical protein